VKLQSLTLREEHRLRVSENKVLRRILAATRNKKIEVGVLQNEELHNLHTSPNVIRMIKSRMKICSGHVACMWRRGMKA
jgi:regulator of replication initiation timing